jgi:predicted DNA-binding transcriptional regulator AlpA
MGTMNDRLLTIDEVARILRRSPKALYNLRYRSPQESPPWIKIGKTIRCSEADLWQWINSRRGK